MIETGCGMLAPVLPLENYLATAQAAHEFGAY
jgi:hypothetical protein